jgi:hypothetical protein
MTSRQTNFVGERYGNFVVMSKAPAVNGKRFWNVINTQTDVTRVVAQTALKDLVDEPDCDNCLSVCPADDNCKITDEGKHVMPNSADISARVVLGNFKDDPFSIPEGFLPEDDSEYPFEPSFVEPCVLVECPEFADKVIDSGVIYPDPFDIQMSAGSEDDDEDEFPCGPCTDADCRCEPGIPVVIETVTLATGGTSNSVTVSPWEPGPNVGWLRVAELCKQLSDAICDAVETRLP